MPLSLNTIFLYLLLSLIYCPHMSLNISCTLRKMFLHLLKSQGGMASRCYVCHNRFPSKTIKKRLLYSILLCDNSADHHVAFSFPLFYVSFLLYFCIKLHFFLQLNYVQLVFFIFLRNHNTFTVSSPAVPFFLKAEVSLS